MNFRLKPWSLTLSTEQFTVSTPSRHQVVMVGGQAELSCQLSPPQSADHMQVGWYRDHYQPVSIYKKEDELSGENIQNYENHTVILKEALGEGKTTLRIYKVSVSDGGQYHCFFKDGDTTEEATVDLKVAGKDRGVISRFPGQCCAGLRIQNSGMLGREEKSLGI